MANPALASALTRYHAGRALVTNGKTPKKTALPSPLKYDPAGLTLRTSAFAKDLGSRVRAAGKEINALLADPALLVLRSEEITTNSLNDFRSDPSLISKFRDKVVEILKKHLFGRVVISLLRPSAYWWERHTEGARRKGRTDTHDLLSGVKSLGVGSLGQMPPSADVGASLSVERLISSLFGFMNRLTGKVTEALSKEIQKAKGLLSRAAKGIDEEIKDHAGWQARRLARHELQSEYAQGQLDAFGEAGVGHVSLLAELVTAGDEKVCPICQEKASLRYTLEEAQGVIPLHVACRCIWLLVPTAGPLG